MTGNRYIYRVNVPSFRTFPRSELSGPRIWKIGLEKMGKMKVFKKTVGILRIPLAAALACVFLAGCAGNSNSARGKEAVPVTVTPKDVLFLPIPETADSVDAALTPLGWGGGRFAAELRKEIAYQFNRKGVAVVEDGSQAAASLTVRVEAFLQGRKTVARFEGFAILKTPQGERRIAFGKAKTGGAEAPDRDDPTVDRIRSIAETVVASARENPEIKKKQNSNYEYQPQMWILF
jgi:hypothetical protein